MKDKVIEFSPDKREMKKAWESFRNLINTANPEDFKSILFYLDPNVASITANVAAYGPDWIVAGRLRGFIKEIEMELYMRDFDDGTVELEEE